MYEIKEGHILEVLHGMAPESVHCVVTSPPYWNKGWLQGEYLLKGKAASTIAKEQGCSENNILYFLNKFKIPTRSVKEVRSIKHWGSNGKKNPMFGKTKEKNPNWKGGISAERQSFYASKKWKKVVQQVWKDSKGLCARCKIMAQESGSYHVHHIVGFKDKSKRTDINNLVLLCKECHNFIHSKANVDKEFLSV